MPVSDALEARVVPQRSVLPNGLVLLTSEQKAIPMVTFTLLIDAGSQHDPTGREGLANLTARLLTYGTRSRTALQISEALDFIGASLNSACSDEVASVTLTLLKKDLDTGINLLADILTASVFPPEEIDRQKQSIIASIRAKAENPGDIAAKKFLETLFPQSPYGRPVDGTEDSVKRLERPGVVDFYRQFYRPDNAILAAVGDVSHQELMKKLTKALVSWEKGTPVKDRPSPPVPGPASIIRINKNLTQANIIIGHAGVSRSNPDYYAIQVMNYILGGGGFSSRLMDSVRNERGLAYSVYSQFDAGKYSGTFQIAMQTKNETAHEAIRIATEELQQIREKGISEEELRATKDYLIGSFPLRLDTNRRIASFLAQMEFFDLGLDFMDRYPEMIRRVTKKDVLQVAKRYLQPEKLIVVVVADQEKVEGKR
jgi:zinc protease